MRVANSKEKKRDYGKIKYFINKRNPRNANTQKLEKVAREVVNIFKAKLIKSEIWLQIENHD